MGEDVGVKMIAVVGVTDTVSVTVAKVGVIVIECVADGMSVVDGIPVADGTNRGVGERISGNDDGERTGVMTAKGIYSPPHAPSRKISKDIANTLVILILQSW